MRNIIVLVVGLIVIAVAAVTVVRRAPQDSVEDTIKLSADQVVTLLGIKGNDGLKVGDIESGRLGVKVKSIALRGTDGAEVDVQDIDLQIKSVDKLAYTISVLRIGKVDVLDWKTTQRVQAFGIAVEQPGNGFLTKLEAAVSSVRSGGTIKTADLSCARIGVDRIDYAVRSKEAVVTKIGIEGLSISGAGSDVLAELSVSRATVGNTVSGAGLKVTNVDRSWADLLLAQLVTQNTTDTAAPAKAAPAVVKPVVKSNRVIPFDHIEVAEMGFAVNQSADFGSGVIKVTKLNITVGRRTDGRVAGIDGSVTATAPTGILRGRNDDQNKVGEFLRAMGNPQLEEQLSCTVKLKSTADASRNREDVEISVQAPGFATVSVAATTRGLLDLIGLLVNLQSAPAAEDSNVFMKYIKLTGRDDGILAFILSDRFKDRADVHKFFVEFPDKWPQVAERVRLASEIRQFVGSPGGITFTAESREFVLFKSFFESFDKLADNDLTSCRLSFSPR